MSGEFCITKTQMHKESERKNFVSSCLCVSVVEKRCATNEIEDAVYYLKAVNLHCKPEVDARTPEELVALIEIKGREIAEVLAALRRV